MNSEDKEQKLNDDIEFAIQILLMAKNRKKAIFLKGATRYIINMCPGDILAELAKGG